MKELAHKVLLLENVHPGAAAKFRECLQQAVEVGRRQSLLTGLVEVADGLYSLQRRRGLAVERLRVGELGDLVDGLGRRRTRLRVLTR